MGLLVERFAAVRAQVRNLLDISGEEHLDDDAEETAISGMGGLVV